MIKVTARARAVSSFTHFAFSIVQNGESGTAACCGLLDPQTHTASRAPSGYGSPVVTERGGDNNTNPNRATTRRGVHDASCRSLMCVKKLTHTLDKPRGLGHAVGSAIQTSIARDRFSPRARPFFSLRERVRARFAFAVRARATCNTRSSAPQRARALTRVLSFEKSPYARARESSPPAR